MTNSKITANVLSELRAVGMQECCLCPGGRNAPFVNALVETGLFKTYYWHEERSAGFFALGKARESERPVAVFTTSGTAAGELLPAAMEAYYTGTPLILVTADRPHRFRGSGAPQTAEQLKIFGVYTPVCFDIAKGEILQLSNWDRRAPLHLNVCFEEPLLDGEILPIEPTQIHKIPMKSDPGPLNAFLSSAENLFVIVSELPKKAQREIAQFLHDLNAPIYLESHSGLREHPDIQHLSITCSEQLLKRANTCDYPIQSVLRIGGVPTLRFWRDLEDLEGLIAVSSVNSVPFSGLSWGSILTVDLPAFFENCQPPKTFIFPKGWKEHDQWIEKQLLKLFEQFPQAEPSLIRSLSLEIPSESHVYLGNSLPIREWDLAAVRTDKKLHITASRGLNGIDGQLSTFLGRCTEDRSNFAILGDLTTLYDLSAPWIIDQLDIENLTIFVINNGGGKIFSRMFPYKEHQNPHSLHFEGVAKLWNLEYERWMEIGFTKKVGKRLVELIPDHLQTEQFWNEYHKLCKSLPSSVYTAS